MEWAGYTIPIEDVKAFIKVENNLEDNIIRIMRDAAIEQARGRMNDGTAEIATVPASVTLAILQLILHKYENRDDPDTIPKKAEEVFQQYYRWPGL